MRRAWGALPLMGAVALLVVGAVALDGEWSLAAAQSAGTGASSGQPAAAPAAKIPRQVCLGCHGNESFVGKGPDGKPRPLYVIRDKFEQSVHGKLDCVDCHTNITAVPHAPTQVRVSCVSCHENRLQAAEQARDPQQIKVMGGVVQQIRKFMSSVHAQPSRQDQSQTNATCYNCHEPHYVYPPGTPIWSQWRMNLPNACGNCHTTELAAYSTSIHGREVLQNHNPKAATCADCHTSHDIGNPNVGSIRLVITSNCGSCHQENLRTYLATYHGQVASLGYAYTAKCFDCHGNHEIQKVDDPRSRVFPSNRLTTCQQCHKNATAGFVTFQPHGNTHDFEHYPYLWLAAKFMTLLLAFVFAVFWTHSGLWFYRSYRERQRRGPPELYLRPRPEGSEPHFQRFAPIWRLAHLIFLLVTMTLVLTGMAVFYAQTAWAHAVMQIFGSPRVTAIVHRVAAAIFLTVFLAHVAYMAVRLWRQRKSFKWFGPDSLIPRPRDFFDFVAMYKWFVGRGPRPTFARWTYWEKFDYWAVFWGVAIIGGSGLCLAFKEEVATVLPGWVFNIATIFHGEEAVLAAVFLFTVHFFNNHFRPDKFPLDTVMFTGALSLEEFKREHTLEYERLVATGELEKHRVPAPSKAFALSSRILGFTLITIGLVLLLLVLIGFVGDATSS